jgi:hypothetical protein
MPDSDRRRSPRVQIFGSLHGHLVALDAPINVAEIGLGGLSFETSIEFAAGMVHEFRLRLGDGSEVAVKGRIVHMRRLSPAAAPPVFAVGVQFIDDDAEVDSIAALLQSISRPEA